MTSEPFTGRSAEMRSDSPWLASEDLLGLGDVEVEIEQVYKHRDVKGQDGCNNPRVLSLKFKGKQKQLWLNATNRHRLVELFGTTKAPEWIGKTITLYVTDKAKRFGGKGGETTFGIRIR